MAEMPNILRGGLKRARFLRFAPSPLQAASVTKQQAIVFVEDVTVFDTSLDNGDIEFDDAITAARKCGFCMG